MEQTKKLYTLHSFGLVSLLGGPLAAGYLFKKQFEALDEEDKGKKFFILGILLTVLLFAIFYFIPDQINDKIPNSLVPLVYTLVITSFAKSKFGEIINTHKREKGLFYSNWRAALIGFIALAFYVIVIFLPLMLVESQSSYSYDNERYLQGLSQFEKNEEKALAVLNFSQNETVETIIANLEVNDKLWRKNILIINDLKLIDDLPNNLQKLNSYLIDYCNLRIKENEYLLKALAEVTNQYELEIMKIQEEINFLLLEIEKM